MTVKGRSLSVRWLAFVALCAAYLAVTVGESVLAPLFPVVADDLGVDPSTAGLALGLGTGSIAVANLIGGHLLTRFGPRPPIMAALGLVVLGGTASATSGHLLPFLGGQVMLGLAAGTFFAPGILTAGVLGGASRRGLMMGLFGVAFSGGLFVAALLGVLGDAAGWRISYLAVAGLGLTGAALVATSTSNLPATPSTSARGSGRAILGRATAVGSAAAVSQYGTVAFFPVFAVEIWDLNAGTAALLLAGARVASVPIKTVAGHLSDRLGPLTTVRALAGVLIAAGGLWVLAPGPAWGAAPALVFAATISGVFPIANLLALDEMGDRGAMLGAFRSVQMGVGAAAAAAIGAGAATIGLRPTIGLSFLAPVALVAVTSHGLVRAARSASVSA